MSRWHCLPTELYELVEHTPGTVLLESAAPGGTGMPPDPSASQTLSRLFTAPMHVCIADALHELPDVFAEIENATAEGYFAAGCFSYECGAFFEPTAAVQAIRTEQSNTAEPGQPLAWFGIYERPYIFNHLAGTFDREPPGLSRFMASSADRAGQMQSTMDCRIALTESQYSEQIAAIHERIRAGDVYQLNLTWPIHVTVEGSSAALYHRLRLRQPAQYGAFLHTRPDRRVLCFSPELFFHLFDEGGTRRIVTRPMKGTAPRGRSTSEDIARAHWLQNDAKNRSENVMIVDLLRNDLGRLCAFNTVRVRDLFAVERYPTLWQMTSTISSELRQEVTYQEIFRALFPCGSVTGAPKIRAMQLLSEMEAQPRGIYTGAIGFFSKAECVFNVAIRTVSLQGDSPTQTGTFGVGSGIVIDSVAGDEFRECLLKAEFLTGSSNAVSHRASGDFSLVETFRWERENPLLELHLDRLDDSAHYFGFPFDRAAIRFASEAYGAELPPSEPFKVRLLLDREGKVTLSHEVLSLAGNGPLRIRVAAQRTNPEDPMYFHKTTYRPVYAEAFGTVVQAGYDDVLFLNTRGEVTEAAIHNVFVEKDGRLGTPPVHCGLLAGVQRRHILATYPNAEERVLMLEDLRQADAIYLSNAVRGLRRAVIDWQGQ